MAELTGRIGGSSHGKGGSMHMFSVDRGFYGGHGIVGAQVPLGTGLAFADRYRNNGAVSFTYFGDGAANQGQVYESFNMAELWRLPVVYVIENNQYAMGTSVERSSAETHLYKRGASLQHPRRTGRRHGRVRGARGRPRRRPNTPAPARGPIILEMKTYRYRGHSMSDPAKYRTARGDRRGAQDPRSDRPSAGASGWPKRLADEATLKAIDAEVRRIVADAAEFARTAPEPDPSELYTDVYLEASGR